MTSKVQTWGNSLAVRIPKAFADDANLAAGAAIDITLEDGRLILTPLETPKYTLAELLAGITPDNVHSEVDFGGPVGNEAW